MRKIFLIPLLALFTCATAWAVEVSNFAQLKAALSASGSDAVVTLANDIAYPTNGSDLLNIERSLTLDGKGYKIVGYGITNIKMGGTENHATTIAINSGNVGSNLDVTIQNLSLGNTIKSVRYYGILAFDGVAKITYDKINIDCGDYGVQQPICFTGTDATPIVLIVKDSYVNSGNSAYPFYVLKPITATITNTTFEGWCSLYFKYRNTAVYGSVVGARGSSVIAENCTFNTMNVHHGSTNGFAVFPIEDDGITLDLRNCSMNAQQFTEQNQSLISLQCKTRTEGFQKVSVSISGDNTHIYNVNLSTLALTGWNGNDDDYPTTYVPKINVPFEFNISGGTFTVDPRDIEYHTYVDGTTFNVEHPFIDPDKYEVNEVSQGGVPVYRVVKKAAVNPETSTLYDLNDAVETAAEGENPVTSFELSTGGTMKLDEDREVTTAGYVQVKDNEDSSEPTVVKVGTTETADPTQKVDQVLVINNGLDVQGDSKVEVQAGSALVIGEGGIVTAKPENIVIEADETGAASLLLDPTITVNQTPDLTVRMTAKQIGKKDGDYYWHRFALPVAAGITSWEKEGSLDGTTYPTYLYGWDYENNDWIKLPNGVKDMVPLQGYTLTLASEEIDPELNELQDVTYIFKGNLVGNTNQALDFQREGFNFFGNSYTGYMDVLTLIQGLESENVEGTVYMWCNDPTDEDNRYQSYEGVPLYKLQNASQRARLAEWQKEVAPMQTFILRLRGADSADETVDYASAIWGNPRYNNNTPNNAPRRVAAADNEESYMEISVKAANGKGSHVDFTQDANHNDAFESGYDVVKFMNERTINLYSTINGEDFSSVVTNTLEGKALSLQTNGEINYTMSFKNVEGIEYAILDNATNKVIAIEEGGTYEFAAQPNSTVEGRFEIVSRAKMPTSVENTEVKADVKGIYTIMGQYLGENFEALPAGVYVVNGVKIVK